MGICWIGFGFAHAVLLRGLPQGKGIVIDVLVGTFLGDTGAYLGGRMFGRRRSRPGSPRTRPSRACRSDAHRGARRVVRGPLPGMAVRNARARARAGHRAVAPVGDLFESLVKREAGTKDSGRLFGAHGGALDRLDAVFFTLVIGYYVWLALS